MTITVPIPEDLIRRIEAFEMECHGLTNWELVLPPRTLYLECQEAVYCSAQFSALKHMLTGPIYINTKAGTITGVCTPKGRSKVGP